MTKEYIEREALIAEYDRVHVGAPGGARKLMEDAPAADVVEVVRCKRCRFAREMRAREVELYADDCVMCTFLSTHGEEIPMFGDGYCNHGERKENDE